MLKKLLARMRRTKISERQAWEMIRRNFYHFGRFDHEIQDIMAVWKKQGYVKEN